MIHLFDPLRRLDPDLCQAVCGNPAAVSPRRDSAAIAAWLSLRQACAALDRLRARGFTELVVAGDGDGLFDALARSGRLDGFRVHGIVSDSPLPDRFAYGLGFVPERARDDPAPDGTALLVLDARQASDAWPAERVFPIQRAASFSFAAPPAGALAADAAQVETAVQAAIANRLARLPSTEAVLFAGIYAYFNFNKFSRALREQGIPTVFMSLNASNHQFKHGQFDLVLDVMGELDLFYWVLRTFPFRVVHFQAWLDLTRFAAAAAVIAKSPVVVECNDLAHHLLAPADYDRLFSAGAYAREMRAFRLVCERADAVVFNQAPAAREAVLDGVSVSGPVLHFHSYPDESIAAWEEPAYAPPYRLVYAGNVNASCSPRPVFGDVQLLGLIRLLTAQGVCFTLLMNPYLRGQSGLYQDYEYERRGNPLFRVEDGLPPERLPAAIAGHHFGSMLYRYPPDMVLLDTHRRFILPTKFFAYLEAGLPVLVSEEIEALAGIVREHGLGLAVSQARLADLPGLLATADYAALKAGVAAWRRDNGLRRHIGELLDLYAAARAHSQHYDNERPETPAGPAD